MKKIVNLILSGEFFFAIFLLGGAFKEAININVDLTVLMFGLTLLIALRKIFQKNELKKDSLIALTWYLVFVFLIVLSMLYTDSSNYYLDKSFRFLTVTSWAFLAPYFLLNNRNSIKKFIYSLSLMAVFSSVVIIRNYLIYDTMFIGLSGENYLNSARLIGIGSLSLLIVYIFHTDISKKNKKIVAISLLITLLALFMTGSRMPVIAVFVTFFAITILGVKIRGQKVYLTKSAKNILSVFLFMLPVLYFVKDMEFSRTLFSRLSILKQSGLGTSGEARTIRYAEALNMMEENFFWGKGIGSFGVNYSGLDVRNYAHNIFLEIGSELGFFGLVAFSSLIIWSLFNNIRTLKYSDFLNVWVFSALIYFLLNAMVSGDLNDNRILFAMIAIAAHSKSFINPKTVQKSVVEPSRAIDKNK